VKYDGRRRLIVLGELLVSELVGFAFSLLLVEPVTSLSLNLAVDERPNDTGEDLLSLSVAGLLTVLFLMLLPGLSGLEGSGTSDQFVAELGLMRGTGNLSVGSLPSSLVLVRFEETHSVVLWFEGRKICKVIGHEGHW